MLKSLAAFIARADITALATSSAIPNATITIAMTPLANTNGELMEKDPFQGESLREPMAFDLLSIMRKQKKTTTNCDPSTFFGFPSTMYLSCLL